MLLMFILATPVYSHDERDRDDKKLLDEWERRYKKEYSTDRFGRPNMPLHGKKFERLLEKIEKEEDMKNEYERAPFNEE